MDKLKYMPVLRVRQEEIKVLKNFNFEDAIYPCIEIIKEVIRLQPRPRKGTKIPPKQAEVKSFEGDYIPLIENINAKHVFVDLPVHLVGKRGMNLETLKFLRGVITNRKKRTDYIKKLIPLGPKVIPVISTYSEVTGEPGSTALQENAFRPHFKTLAFRTFFKTFSRDINQIRNVMKDEDYVIMDWEEMELDLEDGDLQDIVEDLKKLDCMVIIHRNPFPKNITMKGIEHGRIVDSIDNSLLNKYIEFGGNCFSDYAGIKKDDISEGGTISPGFHYYDAVENKFYGFRYKNGFRTLKEFETTIVPAVIRSDASRRMKTHPFDYLGADNVGWEIIKNIEIGLPNGESGQSAAKFKRISMEHYLHCMKVRILNGDFD